MDILFYGGEIVTLEKEMMPEAVLVSNGKIKKVGDLAVLKEEVTKRTRLCDLQGKCLMPAFIDSHSHMLMAGQVAEFANLTNCKSFADVQNVLQEYWNEIGRKKAKILVGFGYDQNFLKEQCHPTRECLDKITTEIPIILIHMSAHFASVNSKTLELAGIYRETKDPDGGKIGRDELTGEPNGYLEEGAFQLVQEVMKSRLKVNLLKMIKKMQKTYFENGITTIQEGAATPEQLKLLKLLGRFHLLKADIVVYPLLTMVSENEISTYSKQNRKYKNHLKVGGYKLVLDGSPQGKTAWLSKPYEESGDYNGYPWMKNEEVEKLLKLALKNKQQVLAHCNGDAASEQFISLYEKVVKERNVQVEEDLRPVMIHCQTVRDDQLDRMKMIKMIASIFVGHVYYWGDVHRKNLGEERSCRISPAKSALKRKLCVNFHQDTPVTEPNMLHSVWCAVQRKTLSGRVLGKEQAISVEESLRCVTINAAYQYYEENEKGSIKEGKKADLVILDKNPLKVENDRIKDVKVLKTFKEGKVVYELEK